MQVSSVSDTLDLPADRVFPVSAQKALLAKIGGDPALLVRSRIARLEHALMEELIPSRREIVGGAAHQEVGDITARAGELLRTRHGGLREQLQELTDLRGKNQGVIEYMIRKVRAEKDEFERGLQQYYAVRSVFTTLTNELYGHLGMDAIRIETRKTRERMLGMEILRDIQPSNTYPGNERRYF